MDTLDNKNVYKLLCSKLLLQYLDIKGIREFSSSCKFIYQKCTKFRLSRYIFKFSEFDEYTSIINRKFKSKEQVYSLQLDYINKIIVRHKPHLLYLSFGRITNYYIFEYFSMNFNYLRSLNFLESRIHIKSFKNIIENLPNLQVLALHNVGIGLEENNPASTKFEFPKYLKNLKMSGCYQFNCDSNDHIAMGEDRLISVDIDSFNLDISNITINTIKSLTWDSRYSGGINSLNQLLTNNAELETLEINSDKLVSDTLSIISKNRNLTKLIVYSYITMPLNNSFSHKLLFIKIIEIPVVLDQSIEYVNQLLQNCPNLEELKYRIVTIENVMYLNMQDSKKLKKLSISHSNIYLLLSVPFPVSTIEYLEFNLSVPFKIKLSMFNNLKHLKRININGTSPEYTNYDYNNQLFDGSYYWREIKYYNSVQFWKVS
ncbi:hypothetical protein CONCODRAFT_70209 [Conidiobolus coronatus NRRL 28638]|uniref:F-box domain-containing protein n=1 Tax=Conidiobolus coronatus (strain ATCC 28846 / CBS 209.66 / NRRL 28638) TaxID=796925 RepID=A0A137P7I9_CONC2|nr:hypothetical protein CONCODRAFT_70209 [Conidiobolus coronatus NRRL 28638]|eukprot:KXN70962.1 hypothetical protein CONCODRAFT_70209 [Conidiobolus coronatus NRRL 28638]